MCVVPNLSRDGEFLQHTFEVGEDRPFPSSAGPVPQFEPDNRAPARGTVLESRDDACPHRPDAVRSQEMDPRGSVDEDQGRRRRRARSAVLIMPGPEPACRARAATLRRWLNSRMARTIASRLVAAFANFIASRSSASGISTVVFMIPEYHILEYRRSREGPLTRAAAATPPVPRQGSQRSPPAPAPRARRVASTGCPAAAAPAPRRASGRAWRNASDREPAAATVR